MLFDGWALHLSPPPDHIEGHPFHAQNNVNGISAESINDLQVLPLDARVEAIQEAYIRKVVDTLHDLPNVLWEVANESTGDGSVDQGVRVVPGDGRAAGLGRLDRLAVLGHRCREAARGRARLRRASDRDDDAVPGRATRPRSTSRCSRSRAEWISPGYDDEIFADGGHPMAPGSPPSRWFADPPPADGAKVDHQRHGPLRPGAGRRALGLEVVPARPSPDPHGLRPARRLRAGRPGRPRRACRRSRPSSRRATRWATRAATRSGWVSSTWSRAAISAPPATRSRTPAASTWSSMQAMEVRPSP